MKLSRFGARMTRDAGISRLMDDLGSALAERPDMLMLGGGNPGHLPEMASRFRERMRRILESPAEFDRLVGNYDPPEGQPRFRRAVADLLRRELGWTVGPENVAVTNGSQSASFMLFNLFAGPGEDGEPGQVLLPVAPEYIGYADQGLAEDFFVSHRPEIRHLDAHTFKYHVDFDAVRVTPSTRAICVSRPTNPTGNVLTDAEVARLSELARENQVPLILDNAYGLPFPGILFTEATPLWDEHVVVCMSLSKLGLPGVRTGIVIAREEIVRALASVNAVLNLTTGGFGQALAVELIESGEVLHLGREVVAPFYRERALESIEQLHRDLEGYDFHVHKPEGAIFLWLWLRDLPVSSRALYERLRARGVLVLSGHYFFPGLREPWPHTEQCLRITYSQERGAVRRGLAAVAEEVRRAYDEARADAPVEG